jgi:hypothetical protein
MALTVEQQAQIEYDNVARAADRRMESIRIARDILMENDRNKPTGERGVSATDVTVFADAIMNYIHQ